MTTTPSRSARSQSGTVRNTPQRFVKAGRKNVLLPEHRDGAAPEGGLAAIGPPRREVDHVAHLVVALDDDSGDGVARVANLVGEGEPVGRTETDLGRVGAARVPGTLDVIRKERIE